MRALGQALCRRTPLHIKNCGWFLSGAIRWGGLRQKWTRTRHKKESRSFLPCCIGGFGRKVLGPPCFVAGLKAALSESKSCELEASKSCEAVLCRVSGHGWQGFLLLTLWGGARRQAKDA